MAANTTDNKNAFVDLGNAREEDQKQVMQEILTEGHCPFCAENLAKYHKQSILKETDHWLLTTNRWPYPHTKHHFLLITKKHVEAFSKLNAAARAEVFKLCDWAITEYGIKGGGLVIRFGDSQYSAGTVKHLHAQLLEPDIDDPTFEEKPVKVRIGRGRKS